MADAATDLVDLVLVDGGKNLIAVIKEVRALTGAGLKEAKDIADHVPSVVASGVPRAQAEAAVAQLEAAGGMAELRASDGSVQSAPAGTAASLELLVERGALSETEKGDFKAALEGRPPEEFRTMTRMLTELHHLYQQGILSESEFNTKKWEVLSRR